jgi:predicted solute-binding protein
MIETLGEGNWTFTYIGTDHDVEKIANDLSIKNIMRFEKNREGIREMFDQEYNSRLKFSLNIDQKKDFKENFYEIAQKNDR